jgi:WD40 repeat protein
MAFSGFDCKWLVVGTDSALFLVYSREGGELVQEVKMEQGCRGVWSIDMKEVEGGAFNVWCGCGDASVRMVKLVSGKGKGAPPKKAGGAEKENSEPKDAAPKPPPTSTVPPAPPSSGAKNVFSCSSEPTMTYVLPPTFVSPIIPSGSRSSFTSKKHQHHIEWDRVRHLSVIGPNQVLAGRQGGTMFHSKCTQGSTSWITLPIAGGHADAVNDVAAYPLWGDAHSDGVCLAYATGGKDGLVCAWKEGEDNKGRPLPKIRVSMGHGVVGVAFSKGGNLMAVGCEGGYVKIFGVRAWAGRKAGGRGSQAGGKRGGKEGRVSPVGSNGGTSPASGKASPVGGNGGTSPSSGRASQVGGSVSPSSVRAPPSTSSGGVNNSTVPPPTFLAEHKTFHEDVSCVKFSPTGEFLAAGSHDNFIDIFNVLKAGMRPVKRLRGHTSYITGMDWSFDGQCLQSTCGAGEILHFWVKGGDTCKMVTSQAQAQEILVDGGRGHMDLNDWRRWDGWSVTIGFPVMGIWPDFADNTDVNRVAR